MSAAFSAIAMTAALVLPRTSEGITEASATRNPSAPKTRRSESNDPADRTCTRRMIVRARSLLDKRHDVCFLVGCRKHAPHPRQIGLREQIHRHTSGRAGPDNDVIKFLSRVHRRRLLSITLGM